MPTCPPTSHKPARQGSLLHHVHRAQAAPLATVIHTKGAVRPPSQPHTMSINHIVRGNRTGSDGCAILGAHASWRL